MPHIISSKSASREHPDIVVKLHLDKIEEELTILEKKLTQYYLYFKLSSFQIK